MTVCPVSCMKLEVEMLETSGKRERAVSTGNDWMAFRGFSRELRWFFLLLSPSASCCKDWWRERSSHQCLLLLFLTRVGTVASIVYAFWRPGGSRRVSCLTTRLPSSTRLPILIHVYAKSDQTQASVWSPAFRFLPSTRFLHLLTPFISTCGFRLTSHHPLFSCCHSMCDACSSEKTARAVLLFLRIFESCSSRHFSQYLDLFFNYLLDNIPLLLPSFSSPPGIYFSPFFFEPNIILLSKYIPSSFSFFSARPAGQLLTWNHDFSIRLMTSG